MKGKKAYPFLVLKALTEYSDFQNPMTHNDIINQIYREYGITMDRKSVASAIDLLTNDLDFDIDKKPDGKPGFYLNERTLDESEIIFLLSAIFSYKPLPTKYAQDLSKKLLGFFSKNQQKRFEAFEYASSDIDSKSKNKELLLNISNITDAIGQDSMISFNYSTYIDDERVLKTDEKGNAKKYIVSPYYLINSRGFCYLLCLVNGHHDDLASFRLDYMVNSKVLEGSTRESIKSIAKYKNGFKLNEYLNNHIYMYASDKPIKVKLKIKNKDGAKFIKEWFGSNATIKNSIATIDADRTTFVFWIMQYSEHFTLLEPDDLIKDVRTKAQNILDTYKLKGK